MIACERGLTCRSPIMEHGLGLKTLFPNQIPIKIVTEHAHHAEMYVDALTIG